MTMTCRNPLLCVMAKMLLKLFSIAIIIGLALTVSCEGKHLKTLPQTSSQNPKSSIRLDSKSFVVSRYNVLMQVSEDLGENGALTGEMKKINKNLNSAAGRCRRHLSLASHHLMNLSNGDKSRVADMKTSLCATLAHIDTCLDGFEYAPEKARNMVIARLDSLRKNVSSMLSSSSSIDGGSAGSWKGRKVLLDSINAAGVDAVVAKDGSGRFKTISEAIEAAPQNSEKRFVIYVKQGVYYENVKIDQSRINIMMYGDGMEKSIVSGKLSKASGADTVDSATFAVYGRGFIARDMGFENTAGPSSYQAVALLSASDNSVFYKCSIDGYQDTLFSYSGRQFYRECRISGTIDFIFGQSSSVFQSCTLLVRKPMPGQVNTITAQGNSDPNCPGGFSIDNCNVVAAEDLAGARTFLGRPWRNYATTVFMKTSLGGLIDPQGWSGWKAGDAPPDTAYFREYGNTGPGSTATAGRKSMTVAEAHKFSVKNFIGGVEWLPSTAVPFQQDF